MPPDEKTSTLGLNLATVTFGETEVSLEGGLSFASQEGARHGLKADDRFFIL